MVSLKRFIVLENLYRFFPICKNTYVFKIFGYFFNNAFCGRANVAIVERCCIYSNGVVVSEDIGSQGDAEPGDLSEGRHGIDVTGELSLGGCSFGDGVINS